jgi:ParB family chromosome partitioning protein
MNIFANALQRGAKKEKVRIAQTGETTASQVSTRAVHIDKIDMLDNVRKNYGEIAELAASIKKHGLQQPITVYASPDQDGRFTVKFGHRRLLALKQLADKDPKRYNYVDCIIADGEDVLIKQVTENVQRSDLTQGELCDALIAMRNQGMSHKAIATVLGKNERYVNNLFIGVNEIMQDDELRNLLTHDVMRTSSSITIGEIVETRSISDKDARLALLKERQEGKITHAELRSRTKALSKAKPDETVPGLVVGTLPEFGEEKEQLADLPLQLWAYEKDREIRIKMPVGDAERFKHLTKLLTACIDRRKGYYLVEGGFEA